MKLHSFHRVICKSIIMTKNKKSPHNGSQLEDKHEYPNGPFFYYHPRWAVMTITHNIPVTKNIYISSLLNVVLLKLVHPN